jgi:hypothetical protein
MIGDVTKLWNSFQNNPGFEARELLDEWISYKTLEPVELERKHHGNVSVFFYKNLESDAKIVSWKFMKSHAYKFFVKLCIDLFPCYTELDQIESV